jgi:hypothetical protein
MVEKSDVPPMQLSDLKTGSSLCGIDRTSRARRS